MKQLKDASKTLRECAPSKRRGPHRFRNAWTSAPERTFASSFATDGSSLIGPRGPHRPRNSNSGAMRCTATLVRDKPEMPDSILGENTSGVDRRHLPKNLRGLAAARGRKNPPSVDLAGASRRGPRRIFETARRSHKGGRRGPLPDCLRLLLGPRGAVCPFVSATRKPSGAGSKIHAF